MMWSPQTGPFGSGADGDGICDGRDVDRGNTERAAAARNNNGVIYSACSTQDDTSPPCNTLPLSAPPHDLSPKTTSGAATEDNSFNYKTTPVLSPPPSNHQDSTSNNKVNGGRSIYPAPTNTKNGTILDFEQSGPIPNSAFDDFNSSSRGYPDSTSHDVTTNNGLLSETSAKSNGSNNDKHVTFRILKDKENKEKNKEEKKKKKSKMKVGLKKNGLSRHFILELVSIHILTWFAILMHAKRLHCFIFGNFPLLYPTTVYMRVIFNRNNTGSGHN